MNNPILNFINRAITVRSNLYPLEFAGGGGLGNNSKSQKSEFESLPIVLQNKLNELENWAKSNLKQSKNNLIWFWILKVPAIIFAASTGVFASLEFNTITIVLGAISSLCVTIRPDTYCQLYSGQLVLKQKLCA